MYIVVNTAGKYFTNDWRTFEGEHRFLWTTHKESAKRYSRAGWAQNAAHKVGGRVEALNKQPRPLGRRAYQHPTTVASPTG